MMWTKIMNHIALVEYLVEVQSLCQNIIIQIFKNSNWIKHSRIQWQ
jgi:hypothetical protein